MADRDVRGVGVGRVRRLAIAALVAAAASGGVAAADGGGACFPFDFSGHYDRVVADDHAVTVCLEHHTDADGKKIPKVTRCVALDLATGAARSATRPAPDTHAPDSRSSPAGLHRVEKVDATHLAIVSTQTHKRTHTFAVTTSEGGGCLEDFRFVGDAIYVQVSVCAGPGATATLYSMTGTKIADIGADNVNAYGEIPIHLDGDRWAIHADHHLAIFDAKTGAVAAREPDPTDHDATSALPENSSVFDADTFGAVLRRLPSGSILGASDRIELYDPATGRRTKVLPLPVCAPKR